MRFARKRPNLIAIAKSLRKCQLRLLAEALAESNVEAVFAWSGLGVLTLVHKRRPALVLMDIDLPDIDGIEITRRIKSSDSFAEPPVVM